MQLGRETRATGSRELVGVDPRNELGLDRRLEDAPRLGNREVALVAENVAESGSGEVGVLAPAGDFF